MHVRLPREVYGLESSSLSEAGVAVLVTSDRRAGDVRRRVPTERDPIAHPFSRQVFHHGAEAAVHLVVGLRPASRVDEVGVHPARLDRPAVELQPVSRPVSRRS